MRRIFLLFLIITITFVNLSYAQVDFIVFYSTEAILAVEVAEKKSNLIEVVGVQEFTGIYNGKDKDGCDTVTIIKKWDAGTPNPRVDTLNYRVCKGAKGFIVTIIKKH